MKAAGIIAIVLGLGVGGVWLASGMHLATQTEKLVETRTTDEFGDEVVDRKWEKTFELGLDFAGPGGGGLVGLGGVLLFLARRRRKAA
ncbi:MAG: hypothetical protein KC549_01890 [Myxococcales bacterium]|nr:hypothetical protein [Myxococcales bacterium]MCB1185160.1 hypothetical protein [bacterium]MCB9545401.1 hypothetical protein [Myxococcales bacterium]